MSKVIEILPFADIPRVKRGRGIVNHLIASKQIGARAIHSGITFMPPRTCVPAHTHNAEEQVTILKGTLKVILDDTHEVHCGVYDSTFISSGVKHELINETDDEVHALITYGSADVTRTFSDTGETVEIGSDQDKFEE